MKKNMRRLAAFGLLFVLAITSVIMLPEVAGISTVAFADSIKLNKTNTTLIVGEALQLKLSNSSANAVWSSANNQVAKVNGNGKVTAVKAGSTVITAKVGSNKYECKVTVRDIDYSSMSISSLEKLIKKAEQAKEKKEAKSKEVYLVKDSIMNMYLTGNSSSSWLGYELEVIIENKGKKSITVSFDSISINGWSTNSWNYFSDIGGGKKKKDSITLDLDDADLSSYKEIKNVEMKFHVFDADSYRTMKEYTVRLSYNGSTWAKK